MLPLAPPDPPLSDGAVTLRPWTLADVPAVVSGCTDEEVARWLDMIPQPYTDEDGRAYVEGTLRTWEERSGASFAVVDVASGAVVGSIGLRVVDAHDRVAEVGYWTAREARGRGVASRALRLVSSWVLGEVEFARLQLRADVSNVPSQRVAENAGFRREGVLRSAHYSERQQRRLDWVMFSLLPGELP